MPNPGYAYLVELTNAHGTWQKVGLAASMARVRDHARHGWSQTEPRTVQVAEYLLMDPLTAVERPILGAFAEEVGKGKRFCGRCGKAKPPVGRTGEDGLTEVRHVDCYGSMVSDFNRRMGDAQRTTLDAVQTLSFDPRELEVPGFHLADTVLQQPRLNEYKSYPFNAFYVRHVVPGDLLAAVEGAWESGAVDIPQAIKRKFGRAARRASGDPVGERGGGGTGIADNRSRVTERLREMARANGASAILLMVRPNDVLHIWVRTDLLEA